MFHSASISRLLIAARPVRDCGGIGASPRRRRPRTGGRTRRASSTSTCCRCPGRPPSAKAGRNAAAAGARSRSNAAAGRSPSWCTGCGRNMSSGFPEYCQRPSPRLGAQHHDLDARPDAGARPDLQRMGQARHLLRPRRAGLFRDHPQGARRGEDPATNICNCRTPRRCRPPMSRTPSSRPIRACRRPAIAVTCNRTRLSEVRICLSKDLQFRACEEIDRRACRRDQVTMPPMRGG